VINPPTDSTLPQGYGYATVTVDALGNIRFAGVLGDGSAVSQGAVINGYGQWLFFVAPYGVNGGVTGTLTFENNSTTDIDGAVQWFKPGAPGISTDITIGGSLYDKTVASVLNFTGPGSLTISGGGLNPTPAPKGFSIAANNAISLSAGTTGLTMSFNLTTGLIMGAFTDSANASHSYTGVVQQKASTGNGLFKANGELGSIYIAN